MNDLEKPEDKPDEQLTNSSGDPSGDPSSTQGSPTAISPPSAADTALSSSSRNTHFVFEHKVFDVAGAYFALTPDTRQPVLNVLLGDLKAAIPFPTLMNAFDIKPDSPDAKLLEVVEKSLRYVKQIRPGESIPPELLNGTASWSVEEHHRIIAKGRLTMQMVSWITGNEHIVVDLAQLEQLVEDPITKQRLQNAFTEIAKRLGLGEERRQEVVDKVDDLAHELSYIEALRERAGLVKSILDKLVALTRVYRTDRTLSQELARMQGLFRKPLREFDFLFDQCDAQTGEIVAALKGYEAQVAYIRQARDELHVRLMDWDELIEAWKIQPAERSAKTEALLKSLYRFLASKFIETKVWERR